MAKKIKIKEIKKKVVIKEIKKEEKKVEGSLLEKEVLELEDDPLNLFSTSSLRQSNIPANDNNFVPRTSEDQDEREEAPNIKYAISGERSETKYFLSEESDKNRLQEIERTETAESRAAYDSTNIKYHEDLKRDEEEKQKKRAAWDR